ncbi:hypothetical protein TRFO_30944 [Tritrichomonas foetus]|uniref:Uncharacterized protein n=1 Tax=Tritrichomonas foetus TaxID=1144522 RepID=A0A1J4JUB2_9EUKA|nr:hypothetical protein TRFO_30944 [Tritrichomonas foetus]|eukprot:OHT02064.1 hypothetical protein TRFO_30944 [Tritrichomonas foetus]
MKWIKKWIIVKLFKVNSQNFQTRTFKNRLYYFKRTLKNMADEIAPMIDSKVTRHCEFDTFVTRVDKRMKHASGLAIHKNAENIPTTVSKQVKPPTRSLHKSKFYKQQVNALKDRKKEVVDKNSIAKRKVAQELESRLRAYQKREAKGEYALIMEVDTIDIPPDPQEMAFFRYCLVMQNYQEPIYSDQ